MSDGTEEAGMGAYLPIGSVVMFGGRREKVPNGWLVCDGTSYRIDAYPELFDRIGHNFGVEERDKDVNFYIPDLRGMFVRGVDDSPEEHKRDPDRKDRHDIRSGNYIGAVVGSVQGDQFRSHSHDYAWPLGYEDKGHAHYDGDNWGPRDRPSSSTGGSETRPVNVYLYYIIKAK